MKRIIKFSTSLLNSGRFGFEMPANAKILSVQNQRDQIVIWAEINTEHALEWRTFDQFETAEDMPIKEGERLCYLGTCQFAYGAFVLHVYEVTKAIISVCAKEKKE